MFNRRNSAVEDPQQSGDPAVDLGLSDFLLEHADPSKGFTARLFRLRRRPGKREQTAFLQTWQDVIPEYEEIADCYGPGEYKMNIIYSPPGKARTATSRVVTIDPSWGGRDRLMSGSPEPTEAADPYAMAREGRREMLEMFTLVMGAMGEMQKGNGNGNGSSTSLMAEMAKAMGNAQIASFEANNKLINAVNRERLALPGADDDDGEEQPFVMQAIQWIMMAWQKYGPQILAAPKQAGGMLKGKAQGSQHIQYALSHPGEYRTLYETFQQQTNAPQDKIDEFIHALGFPTPAELQTEQTTQPQQDQAVAGAQ